MKPKAHVAVIQRREGREETGCLAPPRNPLALGDTMGCALTDTRGVGLEHEGKS